jgi:hypothetical protein
MKRQTALRFWLLFYLVCLIVFSAQTTAARDPLPSWNDGPAKQAIMGFVKAVTDKSNPKYVDPQNRIATFDNDGWPPPNTRAINDFTPNLCISPC